MGQFGLLRLGLYIHPLIKISRLGLVSFGPMGMDMARCLAHCVNFQQVLFPVKFVARVRVRVSEANCVPPSDESIDLESLVLPGL